MPTPFIELNNITIRIKDKFLFEGTNLTLFENDNWVIVGPNGAGKSTLARAIAGELSTSKGEIILKFLGNVENPYPASHKEKISYLSFESHLNLLSKIKEELSYASLATLSTGETRKYLIKKALSKNPKLLILDEPFDGLDKKSKLELKDLIAGIIKKNIHVILITHRLSEIPENINKAILIEDGRIKKTGLVKEILKEYSLVENGQVPLRSLGSSAGQGEKIISFVDVTVEYEGKRILDSISWDFYERENWAILGPNGAGKSTIIKLITGLNTQSYANIITVFGQERGKGALVDINKEIGLVSTDLFLNFQRDFKVNEVIISGFFDSVGLYETPTETQIKKMQEVLEKFNIENLKDKRMSELSFGQRRLVIIGRSLVKNPKLLILDEPCHGLDTQNKQMILHTINEIAQTGTSILLVTHHEDEIIPLITNILYLEEGHIVGQKQL